MNLKQRKSHIILLSVFLITLFSQSFVFSVSLQLETPILDFRGFCYGAFRGVGPDNLEHVLEENIREDMQILVDLNVTDIRTYGTALNQDKIPRIADEYGIKCATGAWLSLDNISNILEINRALEVSNYSSMLIIGNEALSSKRLSENELIWYIEYAKNRTDIPVTTAEPYEVWTENRDLAEVCDVIDIHVHPFWFPVPVNNAATWTQEKYEYVKTNFPNKEVLIGETGWPSAGSSEATEDNQKIYYENLLQIASENEIKIYSFEVFDEDWKYEPTPEVQSNVGPHWGIFNANRSGKPTVDVFELYFGVPISIGDASPYDITFLLISLFVMTIGYNNRKK
jgi:exo-beta-1,3-glucanase (GH17 family)